MSDFHTLGVFLVTGACLLFVISAVMQPARKEVSQKLLRFYVDPLLVAFGLLAGGAFLGKINACYITFSVVAGLALILINAIHRTTSK